MLFSADAGEAQLAGDGLAVDGVGDAGQGAGAQRQLIGARAAVAEAAGVAVQHLEVGQQVVREEHRLRPLEVGVAGHDHLAVGLRQLQEGGLEAAQGGQHVADGLLQVEAQVGGDLVVARASGVQPVGRLADLLPQSSLDVHVHVLELAPEDEAPRLDLLPDLLQPAHDGLGVGGGDDPLAGQHAGVGDGAGDVLLVQPPVDVDAGGEGLRPRVGGLGEASAPDLA